MIGTPMNAWKHWTIEETGAGITVWIDVAQQSQNVFSAAVLKEFSDVLTELERRSAAKFVLIRSRKPHSFFAGADIREFTSISSETEGREVARVGQQLFRRLADLSAPTVAVIRGVCLGGGLELALACDYRVVVDDPTTRLGLPETELGILPGWGGTQRLPRLVGTLQAIAMILQAHKVSAAKARRSGLADIMVTPERLEQELQQMTERLAANGSLGPAQTKRTWVGWFLNETAWGRSLVIGATEKKIQHQVRHYPALGKALQAIKLSHTASAKGFEFEQEAIGELLFTPTCQSLVQLFLNRERARNLQTWLTSEQASAARKVNSIAVLGGGTMGAGIAQTAVKSGLRVVLKEINETALSTAQERIDQTYQSLIARGSLSPQQAEAQKQGITFTTEWPPVCSTELIIEAVPETIELKQRVFKELSEKCAAETVLASNTSALSITEIAKAVQQPERCAGLHFFNPVHRMDLIEVVRGAESSDPTLGTLLQLCRKLGKTPILVNDSPGFVVNRVLMPYLDEAVKLGVEMTARGENDLTPIDREMKRFGMPMGPLELLDQVGIDVAAHVASTMTVVFGENSLTATVLQRLIEQGRLGRKTGHGFYTYHHGDKGKPIGIKPLLEGLDVDLVEFPETPLAEKLTPIQQRLVLAMVNEAGRCLDEGVVAEAWMIDLAMVLGTGFAPFHGGPLRYASQFTQSDLLTTLEQLAEAVSPRYQPAKHFTVATERVQ